MDARKQLILIKDKDKTSEVVYCRYAGSKCYVKFQNSAKVYEYNSTNVQWYDDPISMDMSMKRIIYQGKMLSNVQEALQFDKYIRVFFMNGRTKVLRMSDIKLSCSSLGDAKSANHLKYFHTIAAKVGMRTDDGESLLEKQYAKLTFVVDTTPLATYFNSFKYPVKTHNPSSFIIYPFGCNASQRQAVENAMRYSISIIEGPPGTGKTQTILNIIANAVIQNKTVAVVSNNNSATSNVYEKLCKEKCEYIAAFLGNRQNKANFIENQRTDYLVDDSLSEDEIKQRELAVQSLQQGINEMLIKKNELAKEREKLRTLKIQENNFVKSFEQELKNSRVIFLRKNVTSQQLLRMIVSLEMNHHKGKTSIPFVKKLFYTLFRGVGDYKVYKQPAKNIIISLQKAYYVRKAVEMQDKCNSLQQELGRFCYEDKLSALQKNSMELFKGTIAKRYAKKNERYTYTDIKAKSDEFILNP